MCSQDTTVHHEEDGQVYLLCGHTARRNPHPDFAATWTGFRDNKLVTIQLQELVPVGDMNSLQKWTEDRCSVCLGEALASKEVFGSFRTFQCGHSEGTVPIETPEPEKHVAHPDYLTVSIKPDPCPVCGTPGGVYKLTQLSEGVLMCGHGNGFIKHPNSPAMPRYING